MLRHTLPFQLLFTLLGAEVGVRDLSVQRVREFAGDPIQVLRLRTGELLDQAEVRHRVEVPGGHGHAEVNPGAAADDARNLTRFEEVADHHLGAGGS